MVIHQKYRPRYVLRLVLLFVSLLVTAWFFLKAAYVVSVLFMILSVVQAYLFYKLVMIPFTEIEDFAAAARYRDFSRHFNIDKAPAELRSLRSDFNLINQTFKSITREKETQYQYLQKILELIQTGILLYDTETGKVSWVNESLKKILELPYIPNLHLIEKKNAIIYNAVASLEPGQSTVLLLDADQQKLMLSAATFVTEGKSHKLVALQNINEALDENEARSWQKLLSVMTHEIMNSVAPIASLAATLKQQLQSGVEHFASSKEDLELGIETIQRRSEGLMQFAATYRTLNKITSSGKQSFLVGDLFENVLQLLGPKIEQRAINADIILKDPLMKLSADRHLIEQVLINLVLNAIDALKDVSDPKVVLSGYLNNDGRIIITITDNGAGIPADIMEKVFIPFFSTKASGSGIGLSLCKQIMLLHKGNIHVKSVPASGTIFYLQF
ncbi:HAMP domain-containing sensor histidine kinase [Niabella yanshanensis]|uniref:histidine kinase n=1 Tax=Niabella yanshanensis TaxID=577386 RepID=A0ABZ0W6S0_9BACT|nr:HAMP domain-containing sensor histidine kinase [Niabella yanshanensis]WQD38293.1 HAMP domain-containing sensor histidine kinase [Niabella yanshanensis]